MIYSVKVIRLRAHGSLSGALAGSGHWLIGDTELGTELKSRRRLTERSRRRDSPLLERRRRLALAAQPRPELLAKDALSLRRDRDSARAIDAAYPILRKAVRT